MRWKQQETEEEEEEGMREATRGVQSGVLRPRGAGAARREAECLSATPSGPVTLGLRNDHKLCHITADLGQGGSGRLQEEETSR